MKCGLVILNYKNYELTCKLLENVKDFPEIDHIAVVDNASPNESYEVLKKYASDKVTVLKSDKNGGYSYGNNIGIRYLIEHHNPDIIGISNPDVIFGNELVRRIKEIFKENPDYAILTGFQLDANHETGSHPFWESDDRTASSMIQSKFYSLIVSPFVNLFRKIFRIKQSSKYKEYCEKIKNSHEILNQVWAIEGSLFFIRTSDFESVGLFDEKIFLYYEEDVLAQKIKKLGRKAGVVNNVTFIHDHKNSKRGHKFTFTTFERASIFYFCNYVTDSKILHALYITLICLLKVKHLLKGAIRKLISPLRK